MHIVLTALIISAVYIAGISCVWGSCDGACTYYNMSMGHRFVKAFEAHTRFQHFFTVLHTTRQCAKWNLNKITYLGYMTTILCLLTGAAVVPFSVGILFVSKLDQHESFFSLRIFFCWVIGCVALNGFACLLQGLDSLLNAILETFKK